MAIYKVCPKCGANLDPGERCECESVVQQQKDFFKENTKVNPKTGQIAFCWDRKDAVSPT